MTQDGNARLDGPQMKLLAESLLNAFLDFNDLARLVRFESPPSGSVVSAVDVPDWSVAYSSCWRFCWMTTPRLSRRTR